MEIVPPGIGSRPAMVRSSVDLPEPEGPSTTSTEPCSTLKEMSSSTGLSAFAYCLTTDDSPRNLCRSFRVQSFDHLFQSAGHNGQRPAHDEVHKENHAINPQGSGRELNRFASLICWPTLMHSTTPSSTANDVVLTIRVAKFTDAGSIRRTACGRITREKLGSATAQPQYVARFVLHFGNRLQCATNSDRPARRLPQDEHQHTGTGGIEIPIEPSSKP